MQAIFAFNEFRARIKRRLPSWAQGLLRPAWHRLGLPPLRLAARIRELAGADYSQVPPAHLLAQYDLPSGDVYGHGDEDKYRLVHDLLGSCGVSLPGSPRILDFGCGIAATLSAFRRHLPKAECYGCDIKQDPIGWVLKYRPELAVARTSPMPPLPAEFDQFDLVYAISVWTHMPEAACEAWIQHFHERLKPGGVLFFTLIEPSTDFPLRHGFDPVILAERVRANGGCLYDAGTDMTYIQKQWIERQIEGKFELRYFGPTDYVQWGAVLQRLGS